MSAIGGVLNSINTSLLSEIQKLSPTNRTTAVQKIDAVPATAKVDRFDSSQAADLFKQLRDLQSANPSEFKQVLTDGAKQLQDAAAKQADPRAAKFLSNLADRFQKAADTGDLSAIHPRTPDPGATAPAGANSEARGHRSDGHGGAHKTVSENDGDSDDSAKSTSQASSAAPQSSQDLAAQFTLSQPQNGEQSGLSSDALFAALAPASGASSTEELSSATQIQSVLAKFVTSNPA